MTFSQIYGNVVFVRGCCNFVPIEETADLRGFRYPQRFAGAVWIGAFEAVSPSTSSASGFDVCQLIGKLK
jgi:hypothetical protein